MRIAFVVPSLGRNEGQGSANLELLRRICAAGHDVDVFTGSAPADEYLPGVVLHRLPRLPAWQLGNQLLMLAATASSVRPERYDLVHADAATCARRVDVVAVHTVSARWLELPDEDWRESGLRGHHNAAATRLKARLELRHARRARAVIANSPMTARDLAARGVDPARITVAPFGVDSERFRPPTSDERVVARASFGIRDDEFVVLLVGAHGPRKGMPVAVEALALARPGERLLVAGDLRGGAMADDARRWGLAVTTPGKIPDVRRAYWAADALVAPSLYDAFGMAVLEAMACGLPVVVSRQSGSHEYVSDAGFVLDELGAHDIRACLDVLRADPGRAAAMGARARSIALGMNWDQTGAVLLDLYESLASRP